MVEREEAWFDTPLSVSKGLQWWGERELGLTLLSLSLKAYNGGERGRKQGQ